MYCTNYVAKTIALIDCMVTAQLIYAFVFASAKSRFSHDADQICFTSVFKHCTSVSVAQDLLPLSFDIVKIY